MIMAIGDINISRLVDCDAVGLVETGMDGRAAVSRIAGLTTPGNGDDDIVARIDAPYAMVEGVREIKIACGVEPNIKRAVQPRPRRGLAIAGIALFAGSRRRRNDPRLNWHALCPFAKRDNTIAFRSDEPRCTLPRNLARVTACPTFARARLLLPLFLPRSCCSEPGVETLPAPIRLPASY